MTLEEHSDGAERRSINVSADCTAALVLVESVMHVLIERSVLTVQDAMSAVQTAIDVTGGTGEAGRLEPATLGASDPLLRILDSLAVDAHLARTGARDGPFPPLHSVD